MDSARGCQRMDAEPSQTEMEGGGADGAIRGPSGEGIAMGRRSGGADAKVDERRDGQGKGEQQGVSKRYEEGAEGSLGGTLLPPG